jgi:SAM-dependent methyltransferase
LDQKDSLSSFDEMGAAIKQTLVGLLPSDWFDGKRILDFGCGPGKALRHFLPEAERCEVFGCDIHEPSIRWLEKNLSPPLKVFVCSEAPPLPFPDEHLDLVLAVSVFTHLTDYWSAWLLELHRVLRPGGRLVSTFLGEGMSESIAGEPWDADRIGMNVLRMWQPWDHGGPTVQHSEWWLREHWGRAFEVERVEDGPQFGHGLIVLSKRPVKLAEDELIVPAREDPRELTALLHNVSHLIRETIELGTDREVLRSELNAVLADREAVRSELNAVRVDREAVRSELNAVRADRDCARKALGIIARSRSWRLTKPLRVAAARGQAWRT